jgi:hypothetical protein
VSPRDSPKGGVLGQMSSSVRRALRERNRSQRWLADRCGITEKHLSQMLTGSIDGSFSLWERVLAEVGLALVVAVRDGDGWPWT